MRKPGVTYTIICVCIAMFALSYIFPLTSLLGLSPQLVRQGQIWRIFTYAFVHGSVYHIFVNMYSFYNLGGYMESFLSEKRYGTLILGGILSSAAFVFLFGGERVLTIGFSGVLYAMLAMYFVRLIKSGAIRNPAIRSSIVRNLVVNIMISFMPGVSLLGHAGGFAFGLIYGALVF